MNNLQVEEECTLTGFALGTYRINGSPLVVGDTVTTTLTANGLGPTAIIYTIVASDLATPNAALQTVALNVVAKINNAGMGVSAGGGSIIPPAPGAQPNPSAQVSITNPTVFTLTVASGGSGTTTVLLLTNGANIPFPNVSVQNFDGSTSVLNGYIAICNYLQANTVTASSNMDVMQVGGERAISLRPYEMRQRIELYDYWRGQMGRVLSVGKDAWGFRGLTGPAGSVI